MRTRVVRSLAVPVAATSLVVVASQFARVRDDIGQVAGVIPLYVALLVIMAALGRRLGRAVRFDAAAARALLFTGATRISLRLRSVERIQLTRELQAIGFTLADAVEALAAHDAGGATCESERWRLQVVLDRVDARLAELNALRDRIVQAQDACAGGRCEFKSVRGPGSASTTSS